MHLLYNIKRFELKIKFKFITIKNLAVARLKKRKNVIRTKKY